MRRIKWCLGVLAAMALTAASVSGAPASAAAQPIRTKAQWQAVIAHVREPGAGCYHASYPALQWHVVRCAIPPKFPDAPALEPGSGRAAPAKIGGSGDYAAAVPGLISEATGSFKDVSPNITETGLVDNNKPPVANAFSLQLNTQFFSTPACSGSGDPSNCYGWQQFVYTLNASNAPQCPSLGCVYMQYWLINYDATCPSDWTKYQSDCFMNSPEAVAVPPLTAADLATVQLSGMAASGGEDGVLLSVGSGQASLYTDPNSDSVLDLAPSWNTTEWGVYGDGGSGEANFGANTTLEALTAITTTSPSAPTCTSEGFTAETNNLNLTSTPALGSQPSPTMASKQTNGTAGAKSCKAAPASGGLNAGGYAQINPDSVSCGSSGYCSAGGFYYDSSGNRQAFLVTQSGGSWGTAKQVVGTAALNAGGAAGILSVSCPPSGNCSAGGYYLDSSGNFQAFLVSRSNGTFGTAKEVPGTAALNAGGGAEIESVSCPPSGNCTAGGEYTDSSGIQQAFVVSQVNGTYGQAKEVPGTAKLNTGSGGAKIDSVSCASSGNCSAGGWYSESSGQAQAFVVSEVNGTWGQAKEVPGTAKLNTGSGGAKIDSVSCASSGNCSAGGWYNDSSDNRQAFVVSQVNGTWGQAKEVPGTAALNAGGWAVSESVSCASAGNCSAGGWYYDSSRNQQAFVVNQVGGTWGQAQEVPNTGSSAGIESLSCAGPVGNCSAGGWYLDNSGHVQAFVVSEVGGTWTQAEELPGTAALNADGSAGIDSMSCASAGNCSTGGIYQDSSGDYQALVDSQADGTWGQAEEVPGTNG